MKMDGRRRAVAAGVAGLLCVVAIVSGLLLTSGHPSVSPTPSAAPSSSTLATTTTAIPSATPEVFPTPSPDDSGGYADLDGMPAGVGKAHATPIAITIDDNAVARPQSGFNAASIVYQAPADGGEVRYMMVFQENAARDIGPVRSGRPYFIRWAAEYHAIFGHFGGDRDTLHNVIPSLLRNLYNMDALAGGGCPYHRISTRVMPHNAYTNSEALRSCAARMGYPATQVASAVRPFREDSATQPTISAATIAISYGRQHVGYKYDPATRSYLRSIDGAAQIDAADGKQVTARSVVVMFQRLSIDPNSERGYARPVLDQIGSGEALVFSEGTVAKATWKKESATGLTRFYDKSGKEIALVRGRIFIQAIATTMTATYKP